MFPVEVRRVDVNIAWCDDDVAVAAPAAGGSIGRDMSGCASDGCQVVRYQHFGLIAEIARIHGEAAGRSSRHGQCAAGVLQTQTLFGLCVNYGLGLEAERFTDYRRKKVEYLLGC
jgi:hypothetical protein